MLHFISHFKHLICFLCSIADKICFIRIASHCILVLFIFYSVPGQFSETVVDSDEQIVVKRRKLEKKNKGNFQQNAS